MNEQLQRDRYRIALRILTGSLVLSFMLALWFILRPFWTPLLWAIILTTTTWPVYVRVRRLLPTRPSLAPLLASLVLGVLILLVLIPIPLQLTLEVKEIGHRLKAIDLNNLRATIGSLPVLGPFLAQELNSLLTEPGALAAIIEEHQATILSFATTAARGVINTIVGVIASLVGCFILYRHGETLITQLKIILERIGGEGVVKLLDTVHLTVRGAAYSVLATAIVQGLLAGLGYYISGTPTPLLLGVVTIVVSLIPFGPPIIYIPVSAYLLFFSALPWYHGIGLAVWGIIVVSTVDNFLRPIFISHSIKLSPILVFVGVLGGVASCGLLGVFVGPALMVIAHWLWLELAQPTTSKAT